MATTTPNFGWPVPTSTDLVKDGAVAIESLGDAIDASLLDLKGGTTGQVLAKASNTDMDFTWATDASGIPATIFDAKGDIIAATAADTASRLAVGTNGQVLTADSTAATGIKWATPATSSQKIIQVVTGTYSTNFSTSATSPVDSGLSVSITPTSATSTIAIWHNGNYYMNAGATSAINIRILRGATAVKTYNSQMYDNNNDLQRGEISMIYVDSPATTSATTYKIQIWNDIANTIGAQYNNEESRFILMEVGA